MEAAAEHYTSQDTTYVNRQQAFHKGVVVLEFGPAPDADPGDGNVKRIEAGRFYIVEERVTTCKKCNQVGHFAKDCPEAVICDTCKKSGHKKSACPLGVVCRECGVAGHKRSECPDRTCRKCGVKGHIATECSESPRCYICGEQGHVKKDCPAPDSLCRACGQPGHRVEDCMAGPTKPVGAEDTDPKDTDLKDADAKDTKASDAADSDANNEGQPEGTFERPPSGQLDVQLITGLSDEHISSVSLKFLCSYDDAKAAGGTTTKLAILRFSSTTRGVSFNITKLDKDDDGEYAPDDVRLLSETAVANLYQQLGTKVVNSDLYHVHISLHSERPEDRSSNLLGLGLFSDSEYGPTHTNTMHAIRDALARGSKMDAHFFTLGGSSLQERFEGIQYSIQAQQTDDPLDLWSPRGKMNIQLGQQLDKEARPEYKIPARMQFDSFKEMVLIHFNAAIGELEAIPTAEFIRTTVRLVQFADCSQRAYFILIEMADGLSLRVDAPFEIQFLGENAEDGTAWKGVVIPPTPYSTGLEYNAYIRRPHDKQDGWATDPVFSEKHVLRASDFKDAAALREGLYMHAGISALVRVQQPKSNLEREINTLRELFQRKENFQTEVRMLLNNNPLSVPKVDYFEPHTKTFGEEAVQTAISTATKACGLTDKQELFFPLLRKLAGGFGLVQGVGGTGKTRLIESIALYHYVLYAHSHDPGQVWATSPLNRQLDDLAVRIYKTLCEQYEKEKQTNPKAPHPIVIRRHMRETEKKVWIKPAQQKRSKLGADRDTEYLPTQDEADTEALKLAIELDILKRYKAKNWGDKRLEVVELSEGQWILNYAGVHAEGEEPHPIAHPDKKRFSDFRDRLERYASGDTMSSNDNMQLTLAANDVVHELAQVAHVILMTPHVLSEARSWSASKPYSVLHDEAGKTPERAALHAIVWSRGDALVRHIVLGDTFQPKPVLGPDDQAPFHHQSCVALFQRLLLGGAPQLWLNKQHRFVQHIADLVNDILPGEQLTTASSVDDLPQLPLARQFFEKMGFSRTCGFFDVQSQAEVHEISKSTYNIEHVKRVLFLVSWALSTGFNGDDIGIGVPYTAQMNLYIAGRQAYMECLREWEERQPGKGARLRDELGKVTIFSVDGIQGAQMNLVFFDTTIAGKMGFVRDASRVHLAVSRARVGLVVVGNTRACAAVAAAGSKLGYYKKTAYFKMVHHFRTHGCYINLSNPKYKHKTDKMTVSCIVGPTLEGVHRPRSGNDEPFDFSLDEPYDVELPDINPDLNSSGDNSGEGWGADETGGDGEGGNWDGGGTGSDGDGTGSDDGGTRSDGGGGAGW